MLLAKWLNERNPKWAFPDGSVVLADVIKTLAFPGVLRFSAATLRICIKKKEEEANVTSQMIPVDCD